jgi:hypothetical protein
MRNGGLPDPPFRWFAKGEAQMPGPGFVVLRETADGRWELLGEVARRRGLPARAARTAAILEATGGAARAAEHNAAILRSEWRIARDWTPPRADG